MTHKNRLTKQELDTAIRVIFLDVNRPSAIECMSRLLSHINAIEQERAKEVEELSGALRLYAECSSESCTCGDGWDHDAAQEALAKTGKKS